MKQTKVESNKYFIDFERKKDGHRSHQTSFFALAKKHLTRIRGKGSTTAAQDIDTIVYGVK